MNLPKAMLNESCWKLIQYIDQTNVSLSFEQLKEHSNSGTTDQDIADIVSFLKCLNYPIQLTRIDGRPWIELTEMKPKIKMEFSIPEWLSLQASFPELKMNSEAPFQITLIEKLKELEFKNSKFDLFKYLTNESARSHYELEISENTKNIIKMIEAGLSSKDVIGIMLFDRKSFAVYPQRLAFLDGVLCLIGEDIHDRCLISVEVTEIAKTERLDKKGIEPIFCNVEIDDFIFALRAVSGSEERLILKIHSPENINLNPDYHFLGNPYVTTNLNGELIWAANVEVSDELFIWLEKYQGHFEILDPLDIKEKFEQYLKNDNPKQKERKAS